MMAILVSCSFSVVNMFTQVAEKERILPNLLSPEILPPGISNVLDLGLEVRTTETGVANLITRLIARSAASKDYLLMNNGYEVRTPIKTATANILNNYLAMEAK